MIHGILNILDAEVINDIVLQYSISEKNDHNWAGLPTCSDSTSSPVIRDRHRPLREGILFGAEKIDRRAADTIRRAHKMMMAGMEAAPAGAENWGHGVGDWDEWLKEWNAYKKTAAFQEAQKAAQTPSTQVHAAGQAISAHAKFPASVVVLTPVPQPDISAGSVWPAAAAPAAAAAAAAAATRANRPGPYWGLPTYSQQVPLAASRKAWRFTAHVFAEKKDMPTVCIRASMHDTRKCAYIHARKHMPGPTSSHMSERVGHIHAAKTRPRHIQAERVCVRLDVYQKERVCVSEGESVSHGPGNGP
jgi:hypothetical protein